jgi:KDO2-lipid IV(A) lauroyltransferase
MSTPKTASGIACAGLIPKVEVPPITASVTRRALVFSVIKTIVYQAAVFSVALFPTSLAYRLACIIGRFRNRRRRVASRRLAGAMQAKLAISSGESEECARRYFELEAWDEVETWHCRWGGARKIEKLVELHGLENLDRALAAGKGAVLLTGHIRGLFILMLTLAQHGYKLNALRRKPLGLQNRLARWFNDQYTLISHGACNFIWMGPNNMKTAVQAGATLRRNELLLVLLDSRFTPQSVDANLLGETIQIPSGPVVIAKTIGSPLLNVFVDLNDTGPLRHNIRFGSAYYPSADIAASVQHCVSELEGGIVSNPANWIWFEEREMWNVHQQ